MSWGQGQTRAKGAGLGPVVALLRWRLTAMGAGLGSWTMGWLTDPVDLSRGRQGWGSLQITDIRSVIKEQISFETIAL